MCTACDRPGPCSGSVELGFEGLPQENIWDKGTEDTVEKARNKNK